MFPRTFILRAFVTHDMVVTSDTRTVQVHISLLGIVF